MRSDGSYEYKLIEWTNHRELPFLLTQMANEGWRVEHHRLPKDPEVGYTLFTKFVENRERALLDRYIPVREVYRIVNTLLADSSDTAREFDTQIKAAVRGLNEA